jgi:NhaP-type Na+/H+ or K+/H+ antiporter
MTATLLDFLMILALGILAGTGTGVLIGFIARKQKREWALMEKNDRIITLLLILACSSAIMALLAGYVFFYAAM